MSDSVVLLHCIDSGCGAGLLSRRVCFHRKFWRVSGPCAGAFSAAALDHPEPALHHYSLGWVTPLPLPRVISILVGVVVWSHLIELIRSSLPSNHSRGNQSTRRDTMRMKTTLFRGAAMHCVTKGLLLRQVYRA